MADEQLPLGHVEVLPTPFQIRCGRTVRAIGPAGHCLHSYADAMESSSVCCMCDLHVGAVKSANRPEQGRLI